MKFVKIGILLLATYAAFSGLTSCKKDKVDKTTNNSDTNIVVSIHKIQLSKVIANSDSTVGVYKVWQDNQGLNFALFHSGCDFKYNELTLHWDGIVHTGKDFDIELKWNNKPKPTPCTAFWQGNRTFDISPLITSGKKVLIAQIEGYFQENIEITLP